MSIWPRTRPTVPGYARAWLDPEDRVLAFASTPSGDLVLASQRGLWVTERGAGGTATDAEPVGRKLAWEFVVTARWADDALTVISAEGVLPQIMRRLPPISWRLPDSGDLPRVVRQRVDRSIASSHRQSLGGTSTVLIVGRRVSGRDGLLWYAVFDREADIQDEQNIERARALLDAAAEATATSE